MDLLLNTIVAGVGLGLVYGLLALAFALVFKTTKVANFATGNIAMFGAFIVFRIGQGWHIGLAASIPLGLLAGAILGLAIYVIALRPREDAGAMNLLIRTQAVYLLLYGIAYQLWGAGEPFDFPQLVAARSVSLGGVLIPESTILDAAVSLLLAGGFAAMFYFTRLGLLFRAVADNWQVANLLGVRTRVLTAVAWIIASFVAVVVGVLLAPTSFLSTDMMDPYLLGAITASVLGGLTSLGGAFIGGIIVGIASDLAAVYMGSTDAVLVTFGVMLLVLFVRPVGLFGAPIVERI